MARSDPGELRAARAQLVSYSARLLDDGLAVGTAGNISVRAGGIVAITPSGIGYREMRPADAITQLGGPVRVAPYMRFGSAGLAEAAVAALDGRSAVILRNHGAVTHGRDLEQAYDRALLLEWLARTYRLALAYGEPAILPAAELAEVAAETRRRRYGERRGGASSAQGGYDRKERE